jgi:GH25 family lysozyme M1 (1,4-beta-N-acetylmuramidase)
MFTIRNAENHLAESVRTFMREVEHQYGAHILIFAGFERVDGKLAKMKYV